MVKITTLFSFGPDHILVTLDGNSVYFSNTVYGAQYTTIDGLKLSKAGVVKEFPDLEDNEDWKTIAIQRFKQKIKETNGATNKMNYIINDLKGHGYKPIKIQREGSRPQKYYE